MMKKLISGLVLLAMLACLVLPAAAAEPTALPMTVAEAVDGVSAYCTAAMQAAGTYSDWSILQLARSGNLTDAMRQDYLASLAEKLRACGGVLDKSYYTQYSRTILALTACGENARDFAGYDLTAPLANYDQTVWQGVNGAAFALIAMDSVSYGFAASGTSSRARLVAYLLAQELPGGGWDYSGKTADPDQTAMVLQALAPYRTQANVSAAIDRALNVLSGMQKDDGSFDAWGASSSESISQVLVALCALGIDPAKDSRFVRANGAWLVSALMSFRVQTETGLAFGHTNRTANYMATEQAGYALAAYERFLAGQPALYTMTDTTYGTHTCVRYRDTARHWAQPYVCAVTEQGLMNGVGNDCFDPEGTLNRAMLATVLWRASGSPAADGGSFSDVPAGQWYSTAVSWAQQSGIVQGVGENRFAPMDSITREQLAVMLWRASGSPGSTQSLAAFRKRRQKFRGGPQTQNTRQPADVFASFHQQDVRIQQRDQIPEEARMPPMDHGFALAVLRIAQPHNGPFRAHQKRGIRVRLVQFVMGVFGNGDFEASGFQTLGKPGNERRLAGIAEPYDTDGLHTDLLW